MDDLLIEPHTYNPLNHNLTLKIVLKHVGRAGIADLKTCRLVSSFWNKVAVPIIEQHGYALELDNYEKILMFESILCNTHFSRTTTLTEHEEEQDELESLRMSLKLILNHNHLNQHLSEVAKAAQMLFHHPHLRVAFINCLPSTDGYNSQMHQNENGNLELFSLFKLASRHLTNLNIWSWLDPRHFGNFDFHCYSSVTFPRLTSISFKIHSFSNGDAVDEQVDLTKHAISISKNAPKLSKLVLRVSDGGSEKRAAEAVKTILQSCSSSLEDLQIAPLEFGNSLKLLLEIKLPKLTKLRLSRFGSIYFSAELTQFLVHHCPSLVALQVSLELYSLQSAEGDEVALIPNIQCLNLYSSYNDGFFPIRHFHTHFTRITSKFPSVRCMSLDLGLFFMLGNYLKIYNSGQLFPPSADHEYPVLTNVSALQVHILDYADEMFDLLNFASTIYRHTFPNVKELCIIPSYKLGRGSVSPNIDNEMTEVIQFLCNHRGIETLEIQKYGSNWLEQIPKHAFNLRGLKTLKLVPTKCVNCPGVNLPALLARFPTLEYIQFGNQVATGAELRELQDMIKRFANYNF